MSKKIEVLTAGEIAGFCGFVLMLVLVVMFARDYAFDKRRELNYALFMQETTVTSRMEAGDSFQARRLVPCNKGSGRSWRKYRGRHEAEVTVTPVRRVYASGKIENAEEFSNVPDRTIPCSWRNQ